MLKLHQAYALVLSVVVALFIATQPVSANIHGSSSVVVACPYGATLGDGCPGDGGLFTRPDFFTSYAQQSGQTYGNSGGGTNCVNANCHPPWNVAGVDYGVGITTPIGSLTDPTISVPSGCTYNATGGPISGNPEIICTAGSGLYTLQNLNLSAQNGHRCVVIRLEPGSGGNIVMSNIYFANDPTCMNQGSGGGYSFISSGGTPTQNITLKDFTFLGYGNTSAGNMPGAGGATGTNVPSTQAIGVASLATTGTIVIEYGEIIQWPGHTFGLNSSSGTCPSSTGQYVEYNYLDTDTERVPEGHGALGTLGCYDIGEYGYNTLLWSTAGGAMEATLTTAISASPNSVANGTFTATHNVVVVNALTTLSQTPATSVGFHFDATTAALTIDTVTPFGAFVAPGMGINSTAAYLYANTNSNNGVGGVWQYDCAVSVTTSICPLSNVYGGYYNVVPTSNPGSTANSFTQSTGPGIANYITSNVHGSYINENIIDNYYDNTGLTSPTEPFDASATTCSNPATISGNVLMTTGGGVNTMANNGGTGC